MCLSLPEDEDVSSSTYGEANSVESGGTLSRANDRDERPSLKSINPLLDTTLLTTARGYCSSSQSLQADNRSAGLLSLTTASRSLTTNHLSFDLTLHPLPAPPTAPFSPRNLLAKSSKETGRTECAQLYPHRPRLFLPGFSALVGAPQPLKSETTNTHRATSHNADAHSKERHANKKLAAR